MKISKTKFMIAVTVPFSAVSPTLALTGKASLRTEDSKENEAKLKCAGPPPVHRLLENVTCGTCYIFM